MYRDLIDSLALSNDSALVEAVMRWEHPTLDALPRGAFITKARLASQTIDHLRETDPAFLAEVEQVEVAR